MTWTPEGEAGNESRKIRALVIPYTRGRGVDLGCGPEKVWPHCIGVDTGQTYGNGGFDIYCDITKLDLFADASLDYAYSSHALEDIEDTRSALAEWWRVVKPGGYLVLYLPHKSLYPNIGQPGANAAHKHDFVCEDIINHMRAVGTHAGTGWTLVENEIRGEDNEYSFFQVFRKNERGAPVEFIESPWVKPEKALLIIRYGGIGDMIMLSSILPGLKEQGWHITINTDPRGLETIAHDPHIDQFLLQDKDQVPNKWLGLYWKAIARRYDRVINLSESVEVALLATPGRGFYDLPQATRHQLLNVNYYERTHLLAGVPPVFAGRFYPTDEEETWAKQQLWKIGKGAPVIMWVQSGSSIHKRWPYTDSVIARLMTDTRACVVLCGDPLTQILETGWEKEKRVTGTAGKWTVRQSLAFARVCKVVVGPETGVLNSVANEAGIGKVVMLSHSSAENLTKHWINTTALEPANTPCFPCHRMHYEWSGCVRHPNKEIDGASLCAGNIEPYDAYVAVMESLNFVMSGKRRSA